MAALKDREIRAEAARMKLDLDPLPGEEVPAEVATACAMPPPSSSGRSRR
ncbi:MAG TPA: hypothetical protein VEN78_34110 [Bradyrhizobium sp.]|nr:hypothetical protein [Bradyrhizobium sp.]